MKSPSLHYEKLLRNAMPIYGSDELDEYVAELESRVKQHETTINNLEEDLRRDSATRRDAVTKALTIAEERDEWKGKYNDLLSRVQELGRG